MEELQECAPTRIETLLTNYEALVSDAGELAADWAEMDQQEQLHHRSLSMQVWGMRRALGTVYRAERLTLDQAEKLADLDRALLEEAVSVETCYGPSPQELVTSLLDWGTPLADGEGTVKLAIPLRALPALAQTLTSEAK